MFKKRINTDSGQEAKTDLEDMPELESMSNDPQELWAPPKESRRKKITQLLLERGQISEDQLDQAQLIQTKMPGKPMA